MMTLVKHGLAEGPDGVHDLARLAGVGLLDRHQHQVVKDAFDGEMNVDDFGDLHAHGGRKMRSTALPIQASSMGGLPTIGGGVDGVAAMGDAGEVEDRVTRR